MNITYNQQTDTLRIEFLEKSSHFTDLDGILIHRTSRGKLATIEIQNSSRKIPIEAFKNVLIDLPTQSEEAIEKYTARKQD